MNICENIKKIRQEKRINQEIIADALYYDVSNYSRIETGQQELKLKDFEKIANVLGVRMIDIITYPDVYVNKNDLEQPDRISVTFEVSPDKRDILLNLVTKKER